MSDEAMSEKTEVNIADRLSALEKMIEEQRAQISALEAALSVLLVSQAACHSDMRPANLLAEMRDHDWKRGFEGGTTRVPGAYFYARADQYQSVLEFAANSNTASRYWVPSSWAWLDERRYNRMRALEDRFTELAEAYPAIASTKANDGA
ncbi:hypothetical protein [Defluviimonas salinarum]|uniref:Uncharacterized protein n=1 Tax=Defluviimonas salinarum TaxID=2992147 RepID=A0ABT3J9I5_9RHOB|nr:hypothetical protein [Defluviimonas salinarum]MCW3784348.1 hypothetical protein [Defluviimonas salinarum]